MERFFAFIKGCFQKSPVLSFVVQAIIFSALGWGLFFIWQNHVSSAVASVSTLPNRLSQNEYPLINPLLFCNAEQGNNSSDVNLKEKITNFINDRIGKGMATDISVYIQEYGKGKWVGVNENERYDPASLLKVPLMIAYFQIAEKKPSLLLEQTSFTGDDQNIGEQYPSSNNIKAGVSYSIDDLIRSMVINSDNTATTLLLNYVSESSLLDVYSDLGLPTPPNDPTVEYISAKSYAYFFRILYNATYLNREDSQKALNLLANEHPFEGIESGVPTGIPVADKFGERTVFDQNQMVVSRELHDCGIVYAPGSPYLICIMSKGKDFDNLAQNIHDLSVLVYNNLNK